MIVLDDPVPVDGRAAASAGRLRGRWYHRTRCAVSLADCVAAEAARVLEARLATADPHLLDVCHAEGIDIHRLTAWDGTVWQPRV